MQIEQLQESYKTCGSFSNCHKYELMCIYFVHPKDCPYKWSTFQMTTTFVCKKSFGDEAKHLTEALNKDIEIARRHLVLIQYLDEYEIVH